MKWLQHQYAHKDVISSCPSFLITSKLRGGTKIQVISPYTVITVYVFLLIINILLRTHTSTQVPQLQI